MATMLHRKTEDGQIESHSHKSEYVSALLSDGWVCSKEELEKPKKKEEKKTSFLGKRDED